METESQTIFEHLKELRSKSSDPGIRNMIDGLEDLLLKRERWHEKQKQLDAEEIEILRNLSGAFPGDIKFRFVHCEKEVYDLRRASEENRLALKSVSDSNIELLKEVERLSNEGQRLSFKSAKEQGEWQWSVQNWEKERKLLTEEIARMETKFKQMAQELIQTANSVRKSSVEERKTLEDRLKGEMQEVLSQQKFYGLHEERMLLQGLYTFLQNHIGGLSGSIRLLKERASSMTLPEDEQGSLMKQLFSFPKKLKHVAQIQKQIGAELNLLVRTLDMNSLSLQKLQKGLNEFSPIIKMRDPEPQKLFLNEVLEETLNFLDESHKKNRVKIEKHLKDVPPVFADKEMIQSAMVEVLTNAAECQPDGGVIEISLEESEPSLVSIQILDRGPGIPRHLVEKIFLAFFTTKDGHSGLGLTHALRWISQNGGTIETRSDSGRGEFVFKFPVFK